MSAATIEKERNILPYPMLVKEPPGTEIPKRSWYIRLGLRVGVFMADPKNPTEWKWSPAVATLLIVCGGILAGGGWYIGHQAALIENLQKDATETRHIATVAHDLAVDNKTPTPEPTPEETPVKKRK